MSNDHGRGPDDEATPPPPGGPAPGPPDVPYEKDVSSEALVTRFNELLADGQLELLDHDETQVGGPCPRCAHPGPHRMTYENQIVVIPDLPDADRRLLLDRLDDRVPEAGREQFAVEEIAFFRCRCAHDHGIEDPDPADPKGCGLLLAVEVEEA